MYRKFHYLFCLFAIMILVWTGCNKKKAEIAPGKTPDTTSVQPVPSQPEPTPAPVPAFSYIIKKNESIVDARKIKIKPGAYIGIEAGERGPLKLLNFTGTPDSIITFMNIGKVIIKGTDTDGYGLNTRDCQYFKITGTGDASYKCGIEVDGPHIGISFDHLSSDFELEYTEVHNIGFSGIMAKTDPSCEEATWRGNFYMRNVSIHNNYVHHVGGEGFYIGNSFYQNGVSTPCGTIYPHDIINLEVYNNTTSYTGAEGIQVGAASAGCKVHHNIVEYFGQSPFAAYQNNGIQIGGGTGGLCYNNLIHTGGGNGLIMLGLGDNIAFNNIIVNAGADGVFCDSRYTPGNAFKFVNNTIINPGKNGINLYSETIPMNYVVNNVILKPGSGKYIYLRNENVKYTSITNYTSMDIEDARLKDIAGRDFKPQSNSPLIGAGSDAFSYGVNVDYYNLVRSGKWTIGACQ